MYGRLGLDLVDRLELVELGTGLEVARPTRGEARESGFRNRDFGHLIGHEATVPHPCDTQRIAGFGRLVAFAKTRHKTRKAITDLGCVAPPTAIPSRLLEGRKPGEFGREGPSGRTHPGNRSRVTGETRAHATASAGAQVSRRSPASERPMGRPLRRAFRSRRASARRVQVPTSVGGCGFRPMSRLRPGRDGTNRMESGNWRDPDRSGPWFTSAKPREGETPVELPRGFGVLHRRSMALRVRPSRLSP